MIAIVILVNIILFHMPVFATGIGELEDNLRIRTSFGGICVRPILISTYEGKINTYIIGDMVESAMILSQGSKPNNKESFYIEGSIYFDFKDEAVRKNDIEKIKQMINTSIENMKIHKEIGNDIPDIKTEDSYFWGSFLENYHYQWGYASKDNYSGAKEIDNFRFLTIRINAVIPFSESDWSYDVTKAKLNIYKRYFHTGRLFKMCGENKLLTGIIDPGDSGDSTGEILYNDTLNNNILNDPNISSDSVNLFQNLLNSIMSYILKTRKTFSMRTTPIKSIKTKQE